MLGGVALSMDRVTALPAIGTASDEFAPALPEEQPLAMPTQSLATAPPRSDERLPTAPRGITARRAAIFGGTVVLTAAGSNEMYRALSVGGLTPLELLALLLYVALFAWIAFAFVSALAGF